MKGSKWAKVEWSEAVISVPRRLTSTSRLRFSQALVRYCESHLAELFDACSIKCTFRQRSGALVLEQDRHGARMQQKLPLVVHFVSLYGGHRPSCFCLLATWLKLVTCKREHAS